MRQYLVVKAHKDFIDAGCDHKAVHARASAMLRKLDAPRDLMTILKQAQVVAPPMTHCHSTIVGDRERHTALSELVIPYRLPGREAVDSLRGFLAGHLGDFHEDPTSILPESAAGIRNIGADLATFSSMQFPAAPAVVFGNRGRVREMIDARALRGLGGHGVNVVIIDEGLNKNAIGKRNWGGGLVTTPAIDPGTGKPTKAAVEPGEASPLSHGMMIARNVLDIAPDAKLYDVPLIPSTISRPNIFASSAHRTFRAVIEKIKRLRDYKDENSAWILVNAWAIFDRAGEYPLGDYTCNLHTKHFRAGAGRASNRHGHPLNRIMNVAIRDGIDVVFSAGNCGEFTTDTRCGRNDRGEGHGIWGANAHPDVLTIGAVTANAQWFGYSSEGPAPWGPEPRQKPDVCVPSGFHEDHDAARINSGTSAAAGLAAGVLAAIRENWGPDKLSPAQLKDAINASAGGQGGVWNARTGHGLLDAGALLRQLGGKRAASAA
ncbi:MAG: S8 family serine peptidase [Alphaproteobacteria bacterium]|nr:S8 family serine peptidase [Alphaproteobacteria bacterium]